MSHSTIEGYALRARYFRELDAFVSWVLTMTVESRWLILFGCTFWKHTWQTAANWKECRVLLCTVLSDRLLVQIEKLAVRFYVWVNILAAYSHSWLFSQTRFVQTNLFNSFDFDLTLTLPSTHVVSRLLVLESFEHVFVFSHNFLKFSLTRVAVQARYR